MSQTFKHIFEFMEFFYSYQPIDIENRLSQDIKVKPMTIKDRKNLFQKGENVKTSFFGHHPRSI